MITPDSAKDGQTAVLGMISSIAVSLTLVRQSIDNLNARVTDLEKRLDRP